MEGKPEYDRSHTIKRYKRYALSLECSDTQCLQKAEHTLVRAGRGNTLALFRHLGPAFFLTIEPEQGQGSETVEQQHCLIENPVGAIQQRIGDALHPGWISRAGALRLGISWPRPPILLSPKMGIAFNFLFQGRG